MCLPRLVSSTDSKFGWSLHYLIEKQCCSFAGCNEKSGQLAVFASFTCFLLPQGCNCMCIAQVMLHSLQLTSHRQPVLSATKHRWLSGSWRVYSFHYGSRIVCIWIQYLLSKAGEARIVCKQNRITCYVWRITSNERTAHGTNGNLVAIDFVLAGILNGNLGTEMNVMHISLMHSTLPPLLFTCHIKTSVWSSKMANRMIYSVEPSYL